MAKNNNKGFSLVEIIIAIAVFSILIVPLTGQLIAALKTSSSSEKKQYAVEKGEEFMEVFKTAELASTIKVPDKNGKSDEYVFQLDASDIVPESTTLPDGNVVNSEIKTYKCDKISLGEEYETYSCEVTVDSKAYAVAKGGYIWDSEKNTFKKDEDDNYVMINKATGTVRNLDSKQAAIIAGATYMGQGSSVEANSLDYQAHQVFLDIKKDLLKSFPVYYNQYLSGRDYFGDDSFNKYTTIKVTKTVKGYMVECIVRYEDQTELNIIKGSYESSSSNIYYPEGAYGNGVVYRQEFEFLPPIYLVYAPAVYNGAYCPTDHITIDTSGVSDADIDKNIKVYIFETAADIDSAYEKVIEEAFGVSDVSDLVYTNPAYTTTQESVRVSVNLDAGNIDLLDVFTNFSIDQPNSNITVKDVHSDVSDQIFVYDIKVKLTDSKGHETIVTGTRGEK